MLLKENRRCHPINYLYFFKENELKKIIIKTLIIKSFNRENHCFRVSKFKNLKNYGELLYSKTEPNESVNHIEQ